MKDLFTEKAIQILEDFNIYPKPKNARTIGPNIDWKGANPEAYGTGQRQMQVAVKMKNSLGKKNGPKPISSKRRKMYTAPTIGQGLLDIS